MTRSSYLDPVQRTARLDRYRKDPDPEVHFRSHILVLLADGQTWATVGSLLFCSSRTVVGWVKRFRENGIEAVAGRKPGRPFRRSSEWIAVAADRVTKHTPRDFGFFRDRWCCEAVALLMLELHQVEVHRETVRR